MNKKELEIIQNYFVKEIKERNPAFFGTIHLNLDEHKYSVMEHGLKFVQGYINRIGRSFSKKGEVFIRAAFGSSEGLHFHFIICLPDNPLIIPRPESKLIKNIKNFEHQEFCMSAGLHYWQDYKKESGLFLRADCKIYYYQSEKNGVEYVVRNKNLPYKFKELDNSKWNGDPRFFYWTNMKSTNDN